MSAPLKLTAHQVKALADALEGLTEVTRRTGVRFTPYGVLNAAVGDNTIQVGWDPADEAYVVDDRNGE